MNQITPPGWMLRLLRAFCPAQLIESIEGDLWEAFEANARQRGHRTARLLFFWGVMRFFRPAILLRHRKSAAPWRNMLTGHYITIAVRHLAKRKLYTVINAVGLSVAIAFALLVYLFIQDDQQFDRFHTNQQDIYLLNIKSINSRVFGGAGEGVSRSANMPPALYPVLKASFPEVKYATFFNEGSLIIRHRDKVFSEDVKYVSRDFFSMFSFPLLLGNPRTIFANRTEVVLTPALAQRLFGLENPVGKMIPVTINGKEQELSVSGVITAPPTNSSLDFTLLLPIEAHPYFDPNAWSMFSNPIWVQLHPDASRESFARNLARTTEAHMYGPEESHTTPTGEPRVTIEFTPLTAVHLNHQVWWHKVSKPQYGYVLGGIALLILVIACINYISLALTASATRRMEVGIRKAAGAFRGQLALQFITESVVLAALAMFFGVGLAILFLPQFNTFTSKAIAIADLPTWHIAGVCTGIAVVVGCIAGSYPALVLSGYKPIQVLKGRFTDSLQAGFAKPLVVLQFALSAFLVLSAVLMYRQMAYITRKDLGYHQEQVMVVPTQEGWNKSSDEVVRRFREALAPYTDVVSVAGTSISFSQGWSQNMYEVDGKPKTFYEYGVDPHYIPTLQLTLVEGRNFDPTIASDSNAVIVNEAFVRDLGWRNPLQEKLPFRPRAERPAPHIIGVVKDYHFMSLEKKIEPAVLSMNTEQMGYLMTMLIRLQSDRVPEGIAALADTWQKLSPDKPFTYTFLDEDVAQQYRAYTRWMNITSLAGGFAVLISCLGLFGLAGLQAVNRTREVGIRKVMGASDRQVFVLLNRPFLMLSVWAFVVAIPVAGYVVNTWLHQFAFHVSLEWTWFVITMAGGLLITVLTVSFHAWRAVRLNPAETLKYE